MAVREQNNFILTEGTKEYLSLWVDKFAKDPSMVIKKAGEIYNIIKGGNNLLEVGCGLGHTLLFLSYFYKFCQGIEIMDDFYNRCVVNVSEKNNVGIFHGDAVDFRGGDRKYDTILFDAVLNNITHAHFYGIMKNLRGLIEDGGVCFMTSLADQSLKQQYIEGLPALLSRKGFNPTRIAEIVENNMHPKCQASWWSKEELGTFFEAMGGEMECLAPTFKDDPAIEVKFDVLVRFP
jgi:SAM-dependent methyltransferase